MNTRHATASPREADTTVCAYFCIHACIHTQIHTHVHTQGWIHNRASKVCLTYEYATCHGQPTWSRRYCMCIFLHTYMQTYTHTHAGMNTRPATASPREAEVLRGTGLAGCCGAVNMYPGPSAQTCTPWAITFTNLVLVLRCENASPALAAHICASQFTGMPVQMVFLAAAELCECMQHLHVCSFTYMYAALSPHTCMQHFLRIHVCSTFFTYMWTNRLENIQDLLLLQHCARISYMHLDNQTQKHPRSIAAELCTYTPSFARVSHSRNILNTSPSSWLLPDCAHPDYCQIVHIFQHSI
jgi:hypothetical protein